MPDKAPDGEPDPDADKRRDAMLLSALRRPPEPRPKRGGKKNAESPPHTNGDHNKKS